MFLQFPRELRDAIYLCLFDSTRVTFGKRDTSLITTKTMKPAPNALAILRTCRLVYQEAGNLWLGHVLFSFENPEDLLDKLSALPSTILSQIRHVRTGGRPLMLLPIGYDDFVFYRLVWVLKLLPGLRLNRLTVLGPSHGEISYDTFDGLIKYGNGWKELHFITPNSTILHLTKDLFSHIDWREPQPGVWEQILRQRDGMNSGVSVTVYRAAQSDTPGSAMNTCTRQFYTGPFLRETEEFGVNDTEGAKLRKPENRKEMLFIVKRVQAADIMEQDRSPYTLEQDIRQWAFGMSWAEIRRLRYNRFEYEDAAALIIEDEHVEFDKYNDVDEYEWSPALCGESLPL